jgi:hypothetical protein
MGKVNNISVIIDEQWNGEIGDSIRNKFASPVIGLPQESLFYYKSISACLWKVYD